MPTSEYAKQANQRSKSKRREYLDGLKRDTPCFDCGDRHESNQMHFVHVRGDRTYILGSLNFGWQAMLEEVAKCEIVCRDCHHKRLRGGRLSLSPEKLRVQNVLLFEGKIEWRPDLARFEPVADTETGN